MPWVLSSSRHLCRNMCILSALLIRMPDLVLDSHGHPAFGCYTNPTLADFKHMTYIHVEFFVPTVRSRCCILHPSSICASAVENCASAWSSTKSQYHEDSITTSRFCVLLFTLCPCDTLCSHWADCHRRRGLIRGNITGRRRIISEYQIWQRYGRYKSIQAAAPVFVSTWDQRRRNEHWICLSSEDREPHSQSNRHLRQRLRDF